jgi:hypothetical protein
MCARRTTVVLKMLKRNCGATPTANISSVTGNDDEFLARAQVRKSAAAIRERTAEERLHCTQKHDRCDQQTEDRDGREGPGDGERAFEDKELADETVQARQA